MASETKTPVNDDTVMTEATKAGKEKDAPTEDPLMTLWKALQSNIALLKKWIARKDRRIMSRVLRNTTSIRLQGSVSFFQAAVEYYLNDVPTKALLLSALGDLSTHTQSTTGDADLPEGFTELTSAPSQTALPEIEFYFGLLISSLTLKLKLNDLALQITAALVQRSLEFNRRSLDPLAARAYSNYSLAAERAGSLSAIRNQLLAAYRTACVRRDEYGQSTLFNLLLRNYLAYSLYQQAAKLDSHADFPAGGGSSPLQLTRYLYYTGRIAAVTLDYSTAAFKLAQAARKAPQNTARGFKIAVCQLHVLVQLLMGEIPERSQFNTPTMRKVLKPYLLLTQAVREGDLKQFQSVQEQYGATFKADNNYSLVIRLRQSVIKAGLRRVATSYSAISLEDAAAKLGLTAGGSGAEFVCAKAIRDGVITANIDHDAAVLHSRDTSDIYSTEEPQKAFHKRISFCLDVHSEAIKAMRYPPGAFTRDAEKQKDDHDDAYTTHLKEEKSKAEEKAKEEAEAAAAAAGEEGEGGDTKMGDGDNSKTDDDSKSGGD